MKKRFLAFLLAIAVCSMTGAINAAAIDNGDHSEGKNVASAKAVNEFEAMEELAELPVAELADIGYEDQEIEQIKNYKDIYIEHVENLNTKSDGALKAFGYSDEQIRIIRNFNGTDAELRAVGSEVKISASGSLTYDGDYTNGKLYYHWSWDGVPAFKMKDEIAISWNDWECVSDEGEVYYYNVNTGAATEKTGAVTLDEGDLESDGVAHRFTVAIEDNYYYAKSGGGSFTVRSTVHGSNVKKNMNFYMAYGHSQMNFTGSISFSVGKGGADGSISFSPSFGTTIAGEYPSEWIYCD